MNLKSLASKELMPGFHGKMVHGVQLTWAFWTVKKGAIVPEHQHPHEQIMYVQKGEFEFKLNDDSSGDTYTQICKEVQPKGSIVIFPSDTYHRVKPVTQGIRHSLVLCTCGNPWK